MSDLKPCPFCGSTVYLLDVATQPSGIELWDVYCANHRCYLSGGTNNMYETRQLAIEAWHTRVEPPELAALHEQVKVLREALEKMIMANPAISLGHKGAFEYVSAVEKARLILDQTKPKD